MGHLPGWTTLDGDNGDILLLLWWEATLHGLGSVVNNSMLLPLLWYSSGVVLRRRIPICGSIDIHGVP